MITFKDKQKTLFERKDKLIKNITKSEEVFKRRLDSLNVKYMFQKGFIKGNNYVIVDFYIPKKKICIEIDGQYHNNNDQIKRDKNKDYYLVKQRGFSVVRIKNEEVKIYDLSFLN